MSSVTEVNYFTVLLLFLSVIWVVITSGDHLKWEEVHHLDRVAQQTHRTMMCYSEFCIDPSLLSVASFLIPCFNCCIKMKFGVWGIASNPFSLTFLIQQSHHSLWLHTTWYNSYLSTYILRNFLYILLPYKYFLYTLMLA